MEDAMGTSGANGSFGQGGSGGAAATAGYAKYAGSAGGGGGGSGHVSSVLTNAVLKSGNELFESPNHVSENGHSGNGYVRITLLEAGEIFNKVYEKYETALYRDANKMEVMIENSMPVSIPYRSGYNFKGYYTETNGAGIQLINENGYITDSFTTTYFIEDATLYASWEFASIDFEYTGIQEEVKLEPGTYKLEVWGAQGGDIKQINDIANGGKGGYSSGYFTLTKSKKLYVNVGGQGISANKSLAEGGYNGGGSTFPGAEADAASGGGATHIATKSGLLENLSSILKKKSVLIVAGGGGGATNSKSGAADGGHGGGLEGITGAIAGYNSLNAPSVGTQKSGGKCNNKQKQSSIFKAGFGFGGYSNKESKTSTEYGGRRRWWILWRWLWWFTCWRCWWIWFC